MNKIVQYIVPFILLSITLVAYFLYSSKALSENLPIAEEDFKWGASLNPYPNGDHSQKVLDQVLTQAKILGIKWLRMEYPEGEKNPQDFTKTVVDSVTKKDFEMVLAFQPSQDFKTLSDPYDDGYQKAYQLASNFPKVKYFQLANEPASAAIKQNWSGATADAFNQNDYQKVFLWLQGASAGISKANPLAKKIITGHWQNTGFFELLERDKLNYNIIGWDWFNETKGLTTLRLDNEEVKLIDKLNSFHKELWIMEGGINGNDEGKQANYLRNFINELVPQKQIKGFFVGVLYDQAHLIGTLGQEDGIISLIKNNNELLLGKIKPAYDVYQYLIGKYSQ